MHCKVSAISFYICLQPKYKETHPYLYACGSSPTKTKYFSAAEMFVFKKAWLQVNVLEYHFPLMLSQGSVV